MHRTYPRIGRCLPLLLLGALALLGPLPAASAQSPVSEVVDRAFPALVNVSVFFERTRTGNAANGPADVRVLRPATGVILSPGGLVLTNAHLVAEIPIGGGEEWGEFWLVVVLEGGMGIPAKVVAKDERTDLALLQMAVRENARLPALPLTRLEGKVPGERVVALSLPDSHSRKAFAGVLAFCGGPVQLRDAQLSSEEVLISDARFHDMLDGGPLLDSRGRVLGIHNSSHISPLPPDFEEGEEDEKVESTDYAVIVSATAIRKSFGEWLEEEPGVPLEGAAPEVAIEAIRSIEPSVVSVWTGAAEEHPTESDPGDPHAQRLSETLGSGVVVDPAGLVLTCADLFGEDVEAASVRLPSGETVAGKLVAIERSKKVALVLLELPEGVHLAAAPLADSSEAMAGELVAVVGRPFGRTLTLSVGVLSALEREGFVQLASWVHPGHWGGAMVDRTGRLLGIAVGQPEGAAGHTTAESYLGFAAPISEVRERFLNEWSEHGGAAGPPDPTPCSEEDAALRRTAVARVVAETRSSMINVIIQRAVEKESTGFNPFGPPEKEFKLLGQGSGVVIDESGLALSNWHVVDAAMAPDGTQNDDHRIEVTLADGRSYTARVLSTSRDDDLSLLALQLEGAGDLSPVELGDSDAIRMGAPVVAIGNPHGLASSASAGIVSGKGIDTRIVGRAYEYKGMMMTDAAINPGNSGGALLDLEGRLVGINSAGRVGAGMAIPVNKAREVFQDALLSAERLRSAYMGLKVTEGDGHLVVHWVDPHSPASRAQVEVGDRLLRVGGEEVATSIAFAQARMRSQPGEAVTLSIERRREELELEIVPLSHTAWWVRQSCGLEVTELDYRWESELVREACVALHRAYTGDPEGRPSQLMSGAVLVERVVPLDSRHDLSVYPGDLLLGMSRVIRGAIMDRHELVRFESLADLRDSLEPLATKEGETCELWLWREGEILRVEVLVRRPKRR